MDFQALFQYLKEWVYVFLKLLKLRFTSSIKKDLEIIALRSQVALNDHDIKTGKRAKPKTTPAFRQLWILLSIIYEEWELALAHFKPDTVTGWHKTKFSFHWFKKSKNGRPPISQEAIAIIKQLHEGNLNISPEKIHELLVLLNVTDAPVPNTIDKYLSSHHETSIY